MFNEEFRKENPRYSFPKNSSIKSIPKSSHTENSHAQTYIMYYSLIMLPWFVDRVESARQVLEERSGRQYPSMNSLSMHDHAIRRNQPDLGLDHENGVSYKGRPRPRTHHYAVERPPEAEISRPRPRSFYENPAIGRDYRDQRNLADQRDVRIVGDSPWLFLSINTDGMKSSTRSACNEWLASPLDAGISRAHSTLAGAARQAAE